MNNHPSKDELSGFILGKLPPEATEAVADHLGECPPCQNTVQDLEAHKDTLLKNLRQPAPASLENDPECRRAIENVAGLVPMGQAEGRREACAAPATVAGVAQPSVVSRPGAPVPSREQFVAALLASGIIEADDWAELQQSTPAISQAADGSALAKALVQRGTLTKFQATLLYLGKSKGLLFGDYVVLDRLGAGGMGQVFKARHRSMDRVVALKVLAKAAMNSPDAVKRFQREVKAAAKLIHPNIVTAFDAGRQDGTHYLVMECVEGSDLSAISKRDGRISIEKAIDYIRQAACGLAFAHAKGVVHRDIKPANLLVDAEGTVKILDMGLARLDGEGATAAGDGLTQTGQVMGTVDYMAPEQAFDTRHADAKADMYSLGCTLYRLITGQNLFTAETLVQKILAHREQAPPSLLVARSDVPQALDAIYKRMVAKKPEDRPTMAALVAELDALTNSLADSSSSITIDTGERERVAGAIGASPAASARGAVRNGKKPPAKMMAAGFLGALFLLVGVIVIIRNQQGEEVARVDAPPGTKITPPPGGSVEIHANDSSKLPSGQKPSTATSSASPLPVPVGQRQVVGGVAATGTASATPQLPTDPDRRAAAWVRSVGGELTVATEQGLRAIMATDELPHHWSTIHQIKLQPIPPQRIDTLEPLIGSTVRVLRAARLNNAEQVFRHIQTFKQLQILHAGTCGISGPEVRHLVGLQNLTELVLNENPITDLHHVQGLTSLTSLSLNHTDIADSEAGHLAALKGLSILSVRDTKLTDVGIAELQRNLPNCHVFWTIEQDLAWQTLLNGGALRVHGVPQEVRSIEQLPHGPIELVAIGKSRVPWWQDRFIQSHLPSLKRLENLVLNGTHVTDAALESVGKVKTLKQLTLEGTQVTSAGVVALQKALPDCKIEWDTAAKVVTPATPTTPAPALAVAPFDAKQARAHQEAWARHLGTTVETTNSVGAKMILIPPGEFLMGSTDEQVAAALDVADATNAEGVAEQNIEQAERPQHRVVITKPFLMGATEVTVGQFKKFAVATHYQTEAELAVVAGKNPPLTFLNPGYAVVDDSPAAVITWNDAVAFCNWLSSEEKATYRLPTEAEWEYACRAGTTTQYSFGDDHAELENFAWYSKNQGGQAHPVGLKPPNAFGLYDMHGNLCEWCQDLYASDWYKAPSLKDPVNATTGGARVCRGGTHFNIVSHARSAYRSNAGPTQQNYTFGFRVVRMLDR